MRCYQALPHPAHTLQDGPGRFDATGELRHALWSQTIVQPVSLEPSAPLIPGSGLELHSVFANDLLVRDYRRL